MGFLGPDRWLAALLFAGLSFASWIASGSSMRSKERRTWYNRELVAPVKIPPFVFSLVWPALYIILAFAGYFVWAGGVSLKDEVVDHVEEYVLYTIGDINIKAYDAALSLHLVILLITPIWVRAFFGYGLVLFGSMILTLHFLVTVGVCISAFYVSSIAGGLYCGYAGWAIVAMIYNWFLYCFNGSKVNNVIDDV